MKVGRQRGLTLLELLVAFAILALASMLVAFNAPPPRSVAKLEAERFAAQIAAVTQASAVTGSPARLGVRSTSYSFERYVSGKWVAGADAPAFRERVLRAPLTATADGGDPSRENESPEKGDDVTWLVLDPLGASSPLAVLFSDGREDWRVEVGPSGEISMARHDAP